MSDLSQLPPELAFQILKNLNATDLCLAACVWQTLASDEILWLGYGDSSSNVAVFVSFFVTGYANRIGRMSLFTNERDGKASRFDASIWNWTREHCDSMLDK